jgi:hypothetical protein
MRKLIVHQCPECGATVSNFAQTCASCGAPNSRWRSTIAAAGAAGALVIAILVALVVALGSLRRPPADDQSAADGEFAWITTAMNECDADAAKNIGTLYFIVIPLTADPMDIQDWRTKSLNDIGNGILLNTTTAFDGLKEKKLKISGLQYVFGVRDQSNAVYKWKLSAGVARFSMPDAALVKSFNIQFMAGATAQDTAWGAAFSRQQGNCYWVNAIVGI